MQSFPHCGTAIANNVALIGLPDPVFGAIVMARPKPIQFFARLHVVIHATIVIVELVTERATTLQASGAKSTALVFESAIFRSIVMNAVSASKKVVSWALIIHVFIPSIYEWRHPAVGCDNIFGFALPRPSTILCIVVMNRLNLQNSFPCRA